MVRLSITLQTFCLSFLLGIEVPAPLLPSIMTQATDLPLPPAFDADPSQQAAETTSKRFGSSSPLDQKKIPKWLKVGLSAFLSSSVIT
jgi:tether containing UBX domain for GLUT4